MIETGIDILAKEAFGRLKGRRVGLLANPASVTKNLEHTSEAIHGSGFELACLFGPQHGYRGDTQANMIEWNGYIHPRLGIPVYSLYGKSREPERSVIEKLDLVVVDLPDVGARPYTYLWTSVLMMKACADAGTGVLVLDRPNPIGGSAVEGPNLEEGYRSFVGLYPLAMRHGLTIGEAARMINEREAIGCELEIMQMIGWQRSMYFEETGLQWIPPSPNIPTPLTALVYPGMVLLEGTNISEGRGTTRPFETIGAPWIDPGEFAEEINGSGMEGFKARPLHFTPTFDKYNGEACGGVQIHVTERDSFRPVELGAVVIHTAARLYGSGFRWKEPPYEYEYDIPPIDVLTGGARFRETVESGDNLSGLLESWEKEAEGFREERKKYLLY